eukprot:TRINITY_DN13151_c0_g1_i1.p3 TRINITY_DN13151_c0_g1~~TRINITY_DN13151_c0_g1_i1.p3  ORF type:complete len:120 (+),score=36.77 TRINITY_DN13151_c0_g1_i1:619-978(+)
MEALYAVYCHRVDFVKIYISEAHAIDEWQVYTTKDINYTQPREISEKLQAAQLYLQDQPCSMPLVIDGMSNDAERAYSAHPERLYAVLPDGTVGYKGGVGPFGYLPEELKAWLAGYVNE